MAVSGLLKLYCNLYMMHTDELLYSGIVYLNTVGGWQNISEECNNHMECAGDKKVLLFKVQMSLQCLSQHGNKYILTTDFTKFVVQTENH